MHLLKLNFFCPTLGVHFSGGVENFVRITFWFSTDFSGAFLKTISSDGNQFILCGTQTDFFGVFYLTLPVGGRMNIAEVVSMGMGFFVKVRTFQNGLSVNGICAGLIQSNRIKRSKHSHIGNNGSVIFCMTVTEG